MSGDCHVGSATVRNHIDSLNLWKAGDEAKNLPHVVHGELAGLAVVGVAEYARIARRPGVDQRHADAAQEMPELRHCEDGVLKRIVITVDVERNLFPGRQGQVIHDVPAKLFRSLVPLSHKSRLLDDDVVDFLVRQGRIWSANQFGHFAELEVHRLEAVARSAGLDKLLLGNVFAQIHDRGAEPQGG